MPKQLTLLATCAAGALAIAVMHPAISIAQDREKPPSLVDQLKKRAGEEARKAVEGALAPDADDPNTATDDGPAAETGPKEIDNSPRPEKVPVSTPTKKATPSATATKAAPPAVSGSKPEKVQDRDERPIVMRDADLPLYVDRQVLLFVNDLDFAPEALAAANGLTVLGTLGIEAIGVTMVTAELAAGENLETVVARLEKNKSIAWAQPNYIYQLLGNSRSSGLSMHGLDPDNPYLPQGLPPVSPSATIVLIDSAVDTSHPSLSGANIVQNAATGDVAASPHGTAIAEILVGSGSYSGVAKGARLISIPAFQPTNANDWHAPSTSTTERLVAALDKAQKLRPNVMNLSFGSPTKTDDGVGKLLDRMYADGVCIAAAAGNGGEDSGVRFPARAASTIAVAAVDAIEAPYMYGSRGPEIDIAAWGVDINAAVPGGRRAVSGTSFAAPLVAGAMVRMPACLDARRPAAIRAALAQDAKDLGDDGRDVIFGAGLLRFGEGALASANLTMSQIEASESADDTPPNSILAWLFGGGTAAIVSGIVFLVWRRRKKNPTES